MYRNLLGCLLVWIAMLSAVMAADRVVRFPKVSDNAEYSVVRRDAYRSLITIKDRKEDEFPAKRGVIKNGFLEGLVAIPSGHALSIGVVGPGVNGEYGPIDLGFLDVLKDSDLCGLNVPLNLLNCKQVKSLSRFDRLTELHSLVAEDCNDPRCLDGLKGLEVLELGFHERQDAQVATAWVAAVAKHKSLKSLTLLHFQVNDEHLKTLASLTKLELLVFNEAHPNVSDRGLGELAALKGLREVWLPVGGPAVTDAGLKPFFQMRRLEKLVLYGDYSPAARERLQLAHPKADFEFSDLRRE